MKYFILFNVVLLNSFSANAEEDNLKSVTNFENLEDYYLNMHSRTPQSRFQRVPTTDKETKKAICHNIINSNFFGESGENSVELDDIYHRLKHQHPTIFHTIYRKERKGCLCSCFCGCSDYQYRNAYELRNISVNGNIVEEFVFVCLTRVYETNMIIPYYISDQYNVSEKIESQEDYIAGRFIFENVHNKLELRALAEEPAKIYKSPDGNVEVQYLRIRRHFQPVENRQDDPVCKLTIKNKIRLCSSVLTSTHFSHRIKFWPSTRYVSNRCSRNKVSFQVDAVIAEIDKSGVNYEEWMIVCKAFKIEDTGSGPFDYLVSTAYNNNKVFVYSYNRSTKKIYLENLSTNVSLPIPAPQHFFEAGSGSYN